MGQAPGTSYTLAVPIHLFPLATFYIYADNKDWKWGHRRNASYYTDILNE